MSVLFLICLPALLILSPWFLPPTVHILSEILGRRLASHSQQRRKLLFDRVSTEREALPSNAHTGGNWKGIIGFFHPFCNAGGGGERVLWAAIRATQERWPNAVCVVYTGDHDVDKATMLKKVKERFNISLYPPTVHLLYLSTRHYVSPTSWPRFTLLGQSVGSVILAYDAFRLLVPDIFVDTMGYAFSMAFCRFLFPSVPTGAYVHYPTISTDMLGSLSVDGHGVNAGQGAGLRGVVKRKYWLLFASLYGWAGSSIDVVMTNSTWTQNHIRQLWGTKKPQEGQNEPQDCQVVFPPVAVEELEEQVRVDEESENERKPFILYIAQFRPEKNHQLIINAFADFLTSSGEHFKAAGKQQPKLILIGSVRDSEDATRVYKLRLLTHELRLKESVEFICDASWPQILEWLQRASIGVNGMWNEHFGIGVVEYQAAGLISVVNNSGGPKLDIVVDIDGKPTGFHASSATEYAFAFRSALALSVRETLEMRLRARRSARRFTEQAFAAQWTIEMNRLILLQEKNAISSR